MLILVAGALFALASVPPPRPPPPFSEKAATVATFEAEHVSYEFQRCHLATTNSNGRYVEAMGTARFSPEWKKATLAMENALNVCQDLRQALRNEKESLLRITSRAAQSRMLMPPAPDWTASRSNSTGSRSTSAPKL